MRTFNLDALELDPAVGCGRGGIPEDRDGEIETLVSEALAPAGDNVHVWEIPADASKVRIRITVAGSTVEVRMTQGAAPTGAEPFFSLPPGGPYNLVLPDSGLPFTPGTNYIAVSSPDPPALAATYGFTASYETPERDTRAFAEALGYLRVAQNVDGGWGLQVGEATSFYTTLHVLLALQAYDDYDFDSELADGIAYLLAHQFGDGSFGVGAVPVPYLTALAARNLVRYEVCPFSATTESAVAALAVQQQLDGAWVGEPYDTALALQVLWEYDNDGDGVFADGDCSGVAGDNVCTGGMTVGCDDNCVDHPNVG